MGVQPESRYARQEAFAAWGPEAQHALGRGRALVVGVGGLGSWTSDLLTRAGVGFLRLIDDDRLETVNLHRQGLYDEAGAAAGTPKALAAAERLAAINSEVRVEPIVGRITAENIAGLAQDVDLVIDGTDNFAARYLINDACVKLGRPWVFAGVVRAEAQVLAIRPGLTPCLRCLLPEPPPPSASPTCREVGVLGPAVSLVASLQALEAMKLLAGRADAVSPWLLKLDLWANTVSRLRLAGPAPECPCCGRPSTPAG